MNAMLKALMTFLVGCLVLAVVLYVVQIIIGMLTLPPNVAHLAMIIVGLIGLVFLIYLCVNVFNGKTPGGP